MANIQERGVHVVTKHFGETPLECLERFRGKHPELAGQSMTYAGRLDPMAEGLLLVLSGEAVHDKEKWMDLPKTYLFKILWCVETDTADTLGFVTSAQSIGRVPDLAEVKQHLDKSIGTFNQTYPSYSSKPVNGKPLFQWAREGKLGEIHIPTHEVEMFSAQHIFRETWPAHEVLADIIPKIDLVKGDFRQEEIKQKWYELLLNDATYTIDTIEVSVSSGFYVRQFVTDIAKKLGTKAVTFYILRSRVGDLYI